MPSTHTITNTKQLSELARHISRELKAGDVLLLSGELGSGKTTFTQQLASVLGVESTVNSPTFTIMGEYEAKQHPTIQWLVHIDLYRIPTDQHGVDKDYIAEVIETAKSHKRVVVIEWPEKLSLTVPRAWRLSFSHGQHGGERIITIEEP